MISRTLASLISAFSFVAASANAQPLRPVSDTTTTASGLRYLFLKHGSGAAPAAGDVMVMHGIGHFASGKEFWNTRTTNEPFEYVVGVSGVIRGFGEGMLLMHEGDRVIFIMKPELAYGANGITGIPANSTLVFDYEILAVHSLSITRMMREGVMNIDSTIAAARALPNLKDYYVSEELMLDDATKFSWGAPGNKEKILQFGISLLPNSSKLKLALAKLKRAPALAVASSIPSRNLRCTRDLSVSIGVADCYATIRASEIAQLHAVGNRRRFARLYPAHPGESVRNRNLFES